MKRIRFAMLMITVMVIGAGVAVAIGGGETEVQKVRFTHAWGTEENFPTMFEAFLDKNAEWLEVEQETVASAALYDKMFVDIAAGNTPDVWTFWTGENMMGNWARDGVLANISEYLEESQTLRRGDIPEGAWSTVMIDGVTYGIPTHGFAMYFAYNETIFDDLGLTPPTDADELLEVSRVLRANDLIPFAVGSKGGNPSHLLYSELFHQLPGAADELANLKTTWNFDTPNSLRAAELVADMRDAGMFPDDPVASGEWDPSLALYTERRAAMIYTGPWMAAKLDEAGLGPETVFTPLPAVPGSVRDPATMTQGGVSYGFYIGADGFEDPATHDGVVAVADFLISDEWMAKNPGTVKNTVSVDPSVIGPFEGRGKEWTSQRDITVMHVASFPDSTIQDVFMNSLDELWVGSLNPRDFVDKVQAAFDDAKE